MYTLVMVVALVGSSIAAPQFPSSAAPPLRPFSQPQPFRPQPFRGSTPAPIFASPSPPVFASPAPIVPSPTPGIYKPLPAVKESPNAYFVIVKQASEVNYDGSFNYEYETENGIKSSVSGQLKNPGTPDEAQVIQGGYAYIAPDGTPIEVRFVADETGFHPEGAHLPVPPAIPPAIARSLEYLRSLPPSKDDELQRK
ncbi:endocuticle structural glycoprotein SgAbd-2-like [Lycorma delicatula]|uniref:endocuticle structural glycoprotein SgAbd-2-like n=1 Tax=Lycorma delicatula TaxID=130591 RepID=UPI003F512D96